MKGVYLVAGYPDFALFDEAVRVAEECGFDFLEVGVPFSDPVADGPLLTKAAHTAIERGVNLDSVLDWLRGYSGSMKIFVMTYANILWARGLERVSEEFAECGVKGVIVADLPNEEHWFFKEQGFFLPLIPFATPESSFEDLDRLSETKEGFIYFVSVRGTTGGRFSLDEETKEKLSYLRKRAKVPVVIGFGISGAEDVKSALELADGFVVGTKAVAVLEKGIDSFRNWCKSLLSVC